MIGTTSPQFIKYITPAITFTKTRLIPPLEMEKKFTNKLKKFINTPNNQALKISQIHEQRSN
jgi:hypothetical protein